MLLSYLLAFVLSILVANGILAVNVPSVKEFVELYQHQQGRPCTIINVGFQFSHDLFIAKNNPLFQQVMLDIDSEWDLEKIMKEDKRSFIFSTGCTIFITLGSYVSSRQKLLSVSLKTEL